MQKQKQTVRDILLKAGFVPSGSRLLSPQYHRSSVAHEGFEFFTETGVLEYSNVNLEGGLVLEVNIEDCENLNEIQERIGSMFVKKIFEEAGLIL